MCVYIYIFPRWPWMMDVGSQVQIQIISPLSPPDLPRHCFYRSDEQEEELFFYTTVICLVRGGCKRGGGVPLFGSLFPVIDVRQKKVFILL